MRKRLLLCLSIFMLFGCTMKNEIVESNVESIRDELVVKEVANENLNLETKNEEELVVNVSNRQESEEIITNTPIIQNTDTQESSDNKKDTTVQGEVIQEHKHQFSEITETVYHEEVGHYETKLIKEGWIEEIPIYETTSWMQCNQCGHKMHNGADIDAHYKTNFDCSGWTDCSNRLLVRTDKIEHESEYESVYIVDQKAFSEKVIIGYQCSCGERK